MKRHACSALGCSYKSWKTIVPLSNSLLVSESLQLWLTPGQGCRERSPRGRRSIPGRLCALRGVGGGGGLGGEQRGKLEASPRERGGVWCPSVPSPPLWRGVRVPVKTPPGPGGKGLVPGLGCSQVSWLARQRVVELWAWEAACPAISELGVEGASLSVWSAPKGLQGVEPSCQHESSTRRVPLPGAARLLLQPSLSCAPTSLRHKLPVYLCVCLSHQTVGPSGAGTMLQVASSSHCLAHSRSSENICGSRKERQGREGRERGGAGCSELRRPGGSASGLRPLPPLSSPTGRRHNGTQSPASSGPRPAPASAPAHGSGRCSAT